MKKEYDNTHIEVTRSLVETSRQYGSIIIAAGISMVIFLLSFIEVRNIVLDTGITFLVISIIIQFGLVGHYGKFLMQEIMALKGSMDLRKLIYLTFFNNFGIVFFILGLFYLIFYFKLTVLIIFSIIYLLYYGVSPIFPCFKRYSNSKKLLRRLMTDVSHPDLKETLKEDKEIQAIKKNMEKLVMFHKLNTAFCFLAFFVIIIFVILVFYL